MASQEQMQQQMVMQARQRQMLMMRQRQQAAPGGAPLQQGQMGMQMGMPMQMQMQMQPQAKAMGSTYDDLPLREPNDVNFTSQFTSVTSPFFSACQNGPLSAIQSTITPNLTPAFLHRGLTLALGAGNVEGVRFLLANGAPIARETPEQILSAPPGQQIPLFEIMTQHGWNPNSAGLYGAVLLPKVVSNVALLRWFLDHGANPNLGAQRDNRDRNGGPETDSCAALESAASRGSAEAVQMLLDAGARIQNGTPLHYAAGARPPSTNPGHSTLSRQLDVEKIPVMEVLVQRGADVNQRSESRHMEAQYAVIYAIMAGAVERVKWLLERGADPHVKGGFGSAVEYASLAGGEMKRIVDEAVAAREIRESG